jgi:hypothetical protein
MKAASGTTSSPSRIPSEFRPSSRNAISRTVSSLVARAGFPPAAVVVKVIRAMAGQ